MNNEKVQEGKTKVMELKKREQFEKKKLLTITTICGPMCAGKSCELINIAAQAESSELKYVCYRPEDSKRENDGMTIIKSRSKTMTLQANPLKKSFTIEDLGNLAEMNKIIFDEIHFLDTESIKNFIQECQKTQERIDIIFAGLDMDFTGKEFEQTSYVTSISNKIIKLTAECSCMECEERATHTAKTKGNLNQQIEAASEDMYRAFCKKHWHEANQMYGVQEFQRQ